MPSGTLWLVAAHQADNKKCHFLGLPYELRLQIYERLLVADRPLNTWKSDPPDYLKCLWKFIAILLPTKANACIEIQLPRTCRQVYHEARAVLYGKKLIDFRLHSAEDNDTLATWAICIQPDTFACLHYVRLRTRQWMELQCAKKGTRMIRRRDIGRAGCGDCFRLVPLVSTDILEARLDLVLDLRDLVIDDVLEDRVEMIDSICRDRECETKAMSAARSGKNGIWAEDHDREDQPTIEEFGRIIGCLFWPNSDFTLPDRDKRKRDHVCSRGKSSNRSI